MCGGAARRHQGTDKAVKEGRSRRRERERQIEGEWQWMQINQYICCVEGRWRKMVFFPTANLVYRCIIGDWRFLNDFQLPKKDVPMQLNYKSDCVANIIIMILFWCNILFNEWSFTFINRKRGVKRLLGWMEAYNVQDRVLQRVRNTLMSP